MTNNVFVDDLEHEISLLQQELIVKRMLLKDCRKKLQDEITEHKETKSILSRKLNENKELEMQLNVSLKAAQNLEQQHGKMRELLVKLQVQTNAYLSERQQILDRCYEAELENNKLKNETVDLKDQLKGHATFQENYKIRQSQTDILVNEILSKQEALKKEQARLEETCKEGLIFASTVAVEANFQAKFISEANASQIKLEEQIIRLMAVLNEERNRRENEKSQERQEEIGNYLDEWKAQQKESNERIKELLEENNRLRDELDLAATHVEHLLFESK